MAIFKNRFGNILSPTSVNDAINSILKAYHKEELEEAKKEKREPLMFSIIDIKNANVYNSKHNSDGRMKMKKRFKLMTKALVVALSFAMATTFLGGVVQRNSTSNAVHADEANLIYYGSEDGTGNKSVYAFESNSGIFIVGGAGIFEEKPVGERAWEDYIGQIDTVINNDTALGVPAYAFKGSSVKSVNLNYVPGLKVIGREAFFGCTQLTSVTLPNDLTTIRTGAFMNCSSLKEIEIPASVKIMESSAFYNCSSLEKVTIHGNCEINLRAFGNCPNLKEIIIDGNVTVIGQEAFYGDSSLVDFDFSKIKKIGSRAFQDCSSLKSVDISNVETLDNYAFNRCSGIEHVTLPKNISVLPMCTFMGCSGMKEVEIPSNIKELGSRAFEGCASLEKITFDGDMTSISNYVFSGCSSLDNVVLPEGIDNLKYECFANCESLTNISLPSTLTTIGKRAFYGCGFTEFTVPNHVKVLGDNAFSNCSNLKKLRFDSNDVEKLQYAILESEDPTETLVLSKNVTSFLPDTMYYLQSIKNIEVEEGNPKYIAIDGMLVDKEKMTIVSYPKGRKDKRLFVPDGIKGMETNCINSYGSLREIYLPDGFATIADTAIKTSISKIYIPKSLTSIGPNAVKEGACIYFEGSEEAFEQAATNGEGQSMILHVSEYNHVHKESLLKDTASCTKDGEKTYGCTCGILPERVEEVKATGHKLIHKVVSEPTQTSPGNEKYTCENCSYMEIYCEVAKVHIEKVVRKTTGHELTWDIISYANYYDIYRSVNGGGYELIQTIQWNGGANTYTYLDETAMDKTACYCYKIKARSTWIAYPKDGKFSDVYPSIGLTSVSSLSNVSTGIKISWKKDSNANGYYIYRSKDGGSFSRIAAITKNSTVTYTDANATTNGAKYTYRIYAYKTVDGKKYKSVKPTAKSTYRVSRPTLSSAKCTASGTITATWKRNTKATGYQVKIVQGTSTKTYTITKNSILKKKITKLKKGKTYKVYVRSYKTVSKKKYYSAWSTGKSVKVTR